MSFSTIHKAKRCHKNYVAHIIIIIQCVTPKRYIAMKKCRATYENTDKINVGQNSQISKTNFLQFVSHAKTIYHEPENKNTFNFLPCSEIS